MSSDIDLRDPDWLLRRIHKFRKEVQHVEREYLELRTLLRDVEAALRADPEDEEMRLRVHYLKGRIEGLEKRHPWLVSGKAPEIALYWKSSTISSRFLRERLPCRNNGSVAYSVAISFCSKWPISVYWVKIKTFSSVAKIVLSKATKSAVLPEACASMDFFFR